MSRLIILANEFPYGNWEPYLETEIGFMSRFSHVHICSLQLRKEHAKNKRPVTLPGSTCHPVYYAPGWVYIVFCMRVLFDPCFYKELGILVKRRSWSLFPLRLYRLFIFLSRAHYESRSVMKQLRKTGVFSDAGGGVIYSYRFEYQPYVAVLLKKKLRRYRIVARAHGFDLYEERRKEKYIPMRGLLLSRLERLICISEHGRRYVAEKYPDLSDKVVVDCLGTADHGVARRSDANENEERVFTIVTCSAVVPVKRLHLVADALVHVTDRRICWIHYGDGPGLQQLKTMCEERLSPGITCRWRGHVPNEQVLEEYKTGGFDLFLNVSSSEGLPVSIMEAMSFGIPCIATNVGGSGEIVCSGENGYLIEKEFAPRDLAKLICRFSDMDDAQYEKYRIGARAAWENRFRADVNYRRFARRLYELAQGESAENIWR